MLALALTALQTVMALSTAAGWPLRASYLHLNAFDSGWYACIIEDGYRSDLPPKPQTPTSNVGFFPGYPLLAAALKDILGISTFVALPLTAQLACWGFWTYLLLTWRRWRVPPSLALAGCLAILVHPAAFFLVCGYSESLFLMAAIGFLYWARASRRLALPLAALHGAAMTATRMVGIPLAIVPLVEGILPDKGGKRHPLVRLAVLAGLASLGAALFFAYCYCRFGVWDLYQQTQAIGWNVRPDYRAFANRHIYVVRFWLWRDWPTAYFWSRLTVPVTLGLLAFLLWYERGQPAGRRLRVGLYLGASLIFYVAVAGMSGRGNLDSMIRHHLAVHVLLVMGAVHLVSVAANWTWSRAWWWALPASASFAAQCWFAYRFTHGLWVA